MPEQQEHERPEDLVEAPGEAEQAARSLEDSVDSHGTLQGYYAMNDVKDPQEIENEAANDKQPENREKGHPIP